jgi:AraC-like DNA-binding protein
MTDSVLVSAFVHGLAAGAMLVMARVVGVSRLGAHVRVAAVLAATSIAAWLLSEQPALFGAIGDSWLICALNYPVGGFFWLFVMTIFAEARVTPLNLAPAVILLVSGFVMRASTPPTFDVIWATRNLFSALLAVHAAVVLLRGRNDDLLEGRRRFRGWLLGIGCIYVLVEVVAGFAFRASGDPRWLFVTVGREGGGVIMTLLALGLSLAFLQARSGVVGVQRRDPGPDLRAETADRLMVEKLDRLMAAEGWRREGLTIGDLATDLELPEHRLRRLINQRLGHRNFTDFVNGHRIEAAKRRLADPAEARTTVAAIAFDLGYGSLGPFNRAFRSATGATPTDWRRQALASAASELKEAS